MKSLLLCTDLDRTLIPNGAQTESLGARDRFAQLVARSDIQLAYVTGRDKALVEDALQAYQLPTPDFVITNVGATLYQIDNGQWAEWRAWQALIAADWGQLKNQDLSDYFATVDALRKQEPSKQTAYKLSYYIPLDCDPVRIIQQLRVITQALRVQASFICSIDEAAGVGLLDVLPARASKRQAIEYLQVATGHTLQTTLFAGDSDNDFDVLVSPIPSVVVANASAALQQRVRAGARAADACAALYVAKGGFLRMNGNYSAGVLEGVQHFFPELGQWLETR